MKIDQKIIEKIIQLDCKGPRNEFSTSIKRAVIKAVSENKPINFISFTCSTINPKYLFSSTPWLYVSTNPAGNNLSPDISHLQTIITGLKEIYPRVQLNIIIGNTDPYYIYLQQFQNFTKNTDMVWKKFIDRWQKYEINFTTWLNKVAPGINVKIINWYSFEKAVENKKVKTFESEYEAVVKNIYSYFDKKQLDWEFRKLQTQFGEGQYFRNLMKPDDGLLKDWIIRKFAEYAVQGKWIYENIPNVILIQNEKPSELRSAMYQPLIRKDYQDILPIAYFLGVDNVGYQ